MWYILNKAPIINFLNIYLLVTYGLQDGLEFGVDHMITDYTIVEYTTIFQVYNFYKKYF